MRHQESSWRAWTLAAVCGGGLSLATLAPAVMPLENDSFPFSTYPMFSELRGEARLEQARVRLRDGQYRAVTPTLLGTDEVLQAKTLIRTAIAGGKRSRQRVCGEIAERVSVAPGFRDAEAVELIVARYDPRQYLAAAPSERRPKRVSVRARCQVPSP